MGIDLSSFRTLGTIGSIMLVQIVLVVGYVRPVVVRHLVFSIPFAVGWWLALVPLALGWYSLLRSSVLGVIVAVASAALSVLLIKAAALAAVRSGPSARRTYDFATEYATVLGFAIGVGGFIAPFVIPRPDATVGVITSVVGVYLTPLAYLVIIMETLRFLSFGTRHREGASAFPWFLVWLVVLAAWNLALLTSGGWLIVPDIAVVAIAALLAWRRL